ncbi:MAG: hypothetical protein K2Y08_03550 [Alphaproteobacteria bacterium]|nr:hypothetical protein [Alphaproteobacteria bacterium]
MIFRKKIALLELIACLIVPISSFAMSESEQERLKETSTSHQIPVLNLHDPRGHHGASSSNTSSSGVSFHDEINFFNVGQGHAVLINKSGAEAPLLVDAGCKAHPSKKGMKYDWTPKDHDSLTSEISERILEIWKASNRGTLLGKSFSLNVIITHPDIDHKDLVPLILTNLESKTHVARASFTPTLLLGGRAAHYLGFLERYQTRFVFSDQWPEISFMENLGFLNTSNCITHLFCPRGPEGNTAVDRNRWSIIARIQVNGISSLLPGDADDTVKNKMLVSLGDRRNELETDILLAPHHGAEGTYHPEWDHFVNPRAIIIGAALMHNHPKGRTLLDFLNLREGRGRIWSDRVMAHGLQYYCERPIQQHIEDSFLQREGRLFDKVPNDPIEALTPQPKQWHLAWIDLPIYTLWTTGSLRFEGELLAPKFIDAPHGLMGYIAVPDPQYLLSPYIRGKLTPLIPSERDLHEIVSQRVKAQHNNQEGAQYSNMILKEALLIEDHRDRNLYLNTLLRIFTEIRPFLYKRTPTFQWIREAIVERNRKVDRNEDRVLEAANFIFRNVSTLVSQNDRDLCIDLCDGAFDCSASVLKTFLKSIHNLQRLRQYIKLYSDIGQCGPSAKEINDLCPFGFVEWLQLEKLVRFVREEIIQPSGEPISLGDIFDILPLRLEGKNFKEIGCALVEMEGCVDETQREAIDSLEQFVTSLRKTIPTSAEGCISVAHVKSMQQQGKSFREIRQAIVESEGFNEDLQQLNEIRAAMPSPYRIPYVPLTLEKFVPFDGHPTTLEEYYEKLEEYFPSTMDEYLS